MFSTLISGWDCFRASSTACAARRCPAPTEAERMTMCIFILRLLIRRFSKSKTDGLRDWHLQELFSLLPGFAANEDNLFAPKPTGDAADVGGGAVAENPAVVRETRGG